MSLRLQIIVGVVIVLALIGIFRQVYSNKLNLRYALIWMLVGIVGKVGCGKSSLLAAISGELHR